jgi:hypothetical protein
MSDDALTPEVPENAAGEAERNPWAAPGSVPEGVEGPQYASGEPRDAETKVSLGKGEAGGERERAALPVHEQQTVTSLPEVDSLAGNGGPQGWAGPGVSGALASFPPPHPATMAQNGAVPPPPIAPDGPGQVPYGYPAGYAAPVGYGGGAPGYYGWSGARPMENGMGITAMVLGILAAAGFCMWPAAIVMGVLAVIFGCIGRAKAKRGEASNPGQAVAGIICGVAGVLLATGLVVLVIVAP